MKKLLVVIALSVALNVSASEDTDTTARKPYELRDIEVLGVKRAPDGTNSAEAITRLNTAEIRSLGIDAVKDVSAIAPNFYMPDYGSRMTSSIYVRGLGARMDQPVIGLSIDNIPYLNKDAYDFDIADMASMEILRGAQTVLNGRNTMGGQINIRTLSPLTTKGLRASLKYGSHNTTTVAAAYYGALTPRLGMSLSGQFGHTDGYFRNAYTGKRLDHENSGSARWKTVWRPSAALSVTNVAAFGINRQGGYPYASDPDGAIAYNDTCAYRRSTFADGVTVAWAGKRVVVTSLTSVQYLDDRMDLDQDFTTQPYFTLTQAKREWTVTQDLFTKGVRGKYGWLGGVFAFYKSMRMEAPVTFKDTGISELIESHRNEVNPRYPIEWDTRKFTLGSNFRPSNVAVALYHESTYRIGNWRFEAGMRLDVERASLSYRSFCNTGYTTYHVLPDGQRELYSHTPVDIDDSDVLRRTFVEFIPKATVAYEASSLTAYFNFSKGYKAGGYNTQMFSDVLQQRIMNIMGMSAQYTLDQIVVYEPERSFNYELGADWKPVSDLGLDAVLFFIDCRNQQLTVFPPGTTTGRIMTNAGRTRSFGAELTARWNPSTDFSARFSYGYTNATFRNYNDGRSDYRGKHVPYAPSNTLFAEATWRPSSLVFWGIQPSLTANVNGAGRIYWNEANTRSQNFYCLAGASVAFTAPKWSLRLWGENITGTRYDTFYFLSMGRSFTQRGLPARFGATIRLSI